MERARLVETLSSQAVAEIRLAHFEGCGFNQKKKKKKIGTFMLLALFSTSHLIISFVW
jgi:hypothetical protein